ncbi:MAG: hypothetical protein LBT02_03305 [Rickettsiales bacterium]|jgi:cell division protein FtsB|nr:hypothetical protein [Rickettsiales bacterium]
MDEKFSSFSFQKIMIIFFLLSYVFYIFHHLKINEISLKDYGKNDEKEKKKIIIIKLEKDIELMEKKISSLQINKISEETIDEEIRKNLNYMDKNEIVIYNE